MNCPDRDEWRKYLLEELDPDTLAKLDRHFASCSLCQQVVQALTDEAERGLPDHRSSKTTEVFEGLSQSFVRRLMHVPVDGDTIEYSQRVAADFVLTFPEPPTERGPLGKLHQFHLIQKLGRGGFAAVYLAFDERFRREVAVKILLPTTHKGRRFEEACARFHREAQAIAKLQNPHVVTVYEVGKFEPPTAPGVQLPYMVMEYVPGGSLATHLSRLHGEGRILASREAAEIARQIAAGLAAAHAADTVHRDIKPGNVLIAGLSESAAMDRANGFDSSSPGARSSGDQNATHVKIADFGLALKTDSEERFSRTGEFAGTLVYASPEHFRNEADAQSDLYSTGVILYELLTGERPVAGTPVDIMRQVMEEEPTAPRNKRRDIPRDLETITLKCLQKRPEQRYATAHDLAEDLRRYLSGEPILAQPIPWWTRGMKWARRKPAAASLLALVATTILAIIGGLWWHNAQITRANTEITRALGEVRSQKAKVEDRELLANRFRYAFYANLSQHIWNSGDVGATIQRLNAVVPTPGEPDFRSFEWQHLWQSCHMAVATWHPPTDVRSLDVAPDGSQVAAVTAAGTIWIRDLATGLEREFGSHQQRAMWIAFRRDGQTLLTATGSRTNRLATAENELKLWNWRTGTELKRWTLTAAPMCCYALAPDDRTIAMAYDKVRVRLFDIEAERETQSFQTLEDSDGDWAVSLDFSPDQSRLAVGTLNGRLVMRDIQANREAKRAGEHVGPIFSLAFAPDGQRVVTAGYDKQVIVWDLKTDQHQSLTAHQGQLLAVAFSRNGQFATIDNNRTIHVWDLERLSSIATLSAAEGAWMDLCFSSDGNQLFTGGRRPAESKEKLRGVVTLWNPSVQAQRDLAGHENFVQALAYSPDHSRLVSGSIDRTARVWDVQSGKQLAVLEGGGNTKRAVAYSPDGRTIFTAGSVLSEDRKTSSGEIRFWDAATFQESRAPVALPSSVMSLAVSADGRWLAAGDADGQLHVWERATDRKRDWQIGAEIDALAFAPNRPLLAIGTSAKPGVSSSVSITLLDVETEARREIDKAHESTVWSLSFSRDGGQLASGGGDRYAKVWEVESGQLVHAFLVYSGVVHAVGFTADEKCLVTASRESVSLWDFATQEHRFSFTIPARELWTMAAAPDGSSLAAAGETGLIRVWRGQSAGDDKR